MFLTRRVAAWWISFVVLASLSGRRCLGVIQEKPEWELAKVRKRARVGEKLHAELGVTQEKLEWELFELRKERELEKAACRVKKSLSVS